MYYIYVYTNKINGHQYVGQTNDVRKRYNGHKSNAYNKKDRQYNYPLSGAIRKYGIENFDFEVIEEVNTREEANEREIYWIKEKKSYVSQGGYNVSYGGHVGKVEWDKLKNRSKIFTGEEIEDIQKRLVNNEKYNDIVKYYYPRLTKTFLSNINNGTNYKNPNLSYPLKKDFSGEKGSFSKEELQEIRQEIKQGIIYADIAKRHHITSIGLISMINSGKAYFDKNEKYPLIVKGCADKSWIPDCLHDIVFSSDSLSSIAKKYGKSEATIKKLGEGFANKQKYLIYPIRSHLEENKEIFKKYYM